MNRCATSGAFVAISDSRLKSLALRPRIRRAIIGLFPRFRPHNQSSETKMRLRFLVILAVLFLPACSVFGQTADFSASRVPMAELPGPWRFHTGDNPAWADPSFDDSGWSLLSADKGWSQQGYAGYGGFAWYRLAVTLPAQHGPLALYLPNVDGSFQLFANGHFTGESGGLPPQPHWVDESRMLFPIPGDAANSGRLLLAFRIWLPPEHATSSLGGLYPAPRIGDAHTIAQWRRLQGRELYWRNSYLIVELFANFIGGLASLGFFALRRKEREYLWFGLYLLNWSVWNLEGLYSAFHSVPHFPVLVLGNLLLATGYYTAVEFYRTLCGQKRGWLYAAGVFFAISAPLFLSLASLQPHIAWFLGFRWGSIGFNVCLALIVYRGWRAGSRDAGILMLTLAYLVPEALLGALAATPPFAHQAWAQAFQFFIQRGIRWPFPYWVPSLNGDLANVIVLIVLIRRYARSRRDEERLESELEAARTVQKVLIPDDVPTIPGLQVQAVYNPASQVGGDFFQIVATANGAALIVIGDVSGKGLPAAMTVSLLVGTFRTLAHYTQSPAEILRAMNRRMLSRSDGGFTTCLVLRVEPGGRVTAANAGHLAPYLGGREVSVDYGLPLGLAADAKYAESHFHLGPGDQVTLLTDGVPEARNARGELFGFEKTAVISNRSAEAIAETARAFGQHDDVTVVQLVMEPAPEPAPELRAQALQVPG